MRIGIEAQRLFRRKKHGMEVVAMEHVRQLQSIDRGHEYVLYVRDDLDRDALQETPNFKIHHIHSITYADWEQWQLPAAIRRAGLDFIHCTCNTAPIRCPVPVMLTLHDIIYLEKVDFKGSAYQNFGNLYRRIVVPKVVERSDMIVTVSEYEKQVIMERLNVPDEKVKVVYNGVSPRFNANYSTDLLQSFRTQYRLPSDYLLFLGNTAPKKNTRNVIKAYAEYCSMVNDPLPIVVADYHKHQVLSILSGINKRKLISKFIFPGYIAPAKMPLLYNNASLFLYPSLRESFGMPILESMACGTPVVTSTTSSMPEVSNDSAQLVDPYNPKAIAEGIQLLLSNPTRMEELIKKGKHRASMFTWEASAETLLKYYEFFRK